MTVSFPLWQYKIGYGLPTDGSSTEAANFGWVEQDIVFVVFIGFVLSTHLPKTRYPKLGLDERGLTATFTKRRLEEADRITLQYDVNTIEC